MDKRMFYVHRIFGCWLIAGLVSFPPIGFAQVFEQKPNLQPLPAFDVDLVGGTKLIFSTTSWNSGAGPLELRAGPTDRGGRKQDRKQKVYQRVYLDDGGSYDRLAGRFEWHSGHKHFHFNDYALYTLQPIDAPGGSQRTGSKTTFCIMDTDRIDTSLPPFYPGCGSSVQGMSVGWGDTYGYWLSGQELDFTGNPDGIYQLKIEIDPKNLLVETNEHDNVSCVLLDISNVTVNNVSDCPP